MNDPHHPPAGSMYSREERSPDGAWCVLYDYMDGGKSPLIVSPRVIEVRTQRIVIDLWRSCINASAGEFTPHGFRLQARDPYGPADVRASIDAVAGKFWIEEPTRGHPQPLAELEVTLHTLFEQARSEYRARHASPPAPPVTSWWQRFRQSVR